MCKYLELQWIWGFSFTNRTRIHMSLIPIYLKQSQNVDDEPPQITTHPLLLSVGQDRVILTGDHFDILDPDTEPSDIQITLANEPINGLNNALIYFNY